MSYLEELLPEFRKGAKIRRSNWEKNEYIFIHDKCLIIDEQNYEFDFTVDELMANDWELYQEPIDWDYIIKNKCLCWFCDDKELKTFCSPLGYVDNTNTFKFKALGGAGWKNCRPVRRDEVTFYEDRKDER